MQDAIRALLEELGSSVADVPGYAAVITQTLNEDGTHTLAETSGPNERNGELRAAKETLIAARDQGAELSREELDEMIELLEGLARD